MWLCVGGHELIERQEGRDGHAGSASGGVGSVGLERTDSVKGVGDFFLAVLVKLHHDLVSHPLRPHPYHRARGVRGLAGDVEGDSYPSPRIRRRFHASYMPVERCLGTRGRQSPTARLARASRLLLLALRTSSTVPSVVEDCGREGQSLVSRPPRPETRTR